MTDTTTLAPVPDFLSVIDEQLWLDVLDAAMERGITAEELIHTAVADDLCR
jgi:hypothetical protein